MGSGPLVLMLASRTQAVFTGLQVVLQHHGAPGPIVGMLREQLHDHLDGCESEIVWLKRCKYVLTYPLAQYLRNELPPPPEVKFSPTGGLRGWMSKRLYAFSRKNTHLWCSWLQAKRAALPASRSFIDYTYKKHFDILSACDPGDPFLIEEVFENRTFLSVLRKVKARITKKLQDPLRYLKFRPSTSASFEKQRGEGGQQRALFESTFADLDEYSRWTSADYSRIIAGEIGRTDLESMTWFPKCYHKLVRNREGDVQNLEPTGDVIEYRNSQFEWDSSVTVLQRLEEARLTGKPCQAKIQGLLEPMKVRTISKGESALYYFCKPIQKAMHTAMRDMSCFRLIGRPFCPTDLYDLKEKAEPGDEWFSIDYSNATDGLSYDYSGRILRYLTSDLPESMRRAADLVLGPHELHYPTGCGRVWVRGIQANGQLMGSILSFPILCLANLGLYLRVNQERQQDWTNEEILNHVLVNGDDMLYTAPVELWQVHTDLGSKLGLENSIGKSYHHKVYSNINSTSCHFNLDAERRDGYPYRQGSTPWLIPFLNTGLFMGQSKVMGEVDGECKVRQAIIAEKNCPCCAEETMTLETYERTPEQKCLRAISEMPNVLCLNPTERGAFMSKAYRLCFLPHIGHFETQGTNPVKDALNAASRDRKAAEKPTHLLSTLQKVLDGSLPGRGNALLKRFLHRHGETIKKETAILVRDRRNRTHMETRNIFLPCSVGGMGILPPEGWKFTTTKFQKEYSRILAAVYYTEATSQLPLPGYPISSDLARIETKVMPWDFVDPTEPKEAFPMYINNGVKRLLRPRLAGQPWRTHAIRWDVSSTSILL